MLILICMPHFDRFARDFRLMFEKEGYSRVFTIKQQSDIEAFMRFISQQGQANRLQQRLPSPPSMQRQPPVITPASQHAAPQQWQPSGPHMIGASQHAAPQQWQPSGPHMTGASQHAAPQQWLSPDPHNSAAAETWRLREGLECHHSEAHGMDADGGANGMPGMRHANSDEQYNGQHPAEMPAGSDIEGFALSWQIGFLWIAQCIATA